MTTEPAETPQGSVRAVPFELVPAGDGLTLEGYAAVFNSPTRIANRFEDFTETIAPGAFARAIRANPKPVMQFDHGTHPLLGSIPVGAIQSMREDDRGLFVSARIHDNWLTEPVRDAISEGSITGMSFRFNAEGDQVEWSDDRESRTVRDLDLHELGPVVWPAYTDTTVSLRSKEFAAAIRDEPELLHDLSIGILLANREQDSTEDDDPTSDDDTDARTDEVPAPEDSDDVRVVNPAKHALALMAVRTDLATQRSRLATHELSVN